MATLVHRLRHRLPLGDAGTSLMEMVVGMALMSIFMGIFTTSVIQMSSSTNKTQAVENSSAQLNTAFDRLDKQVRYAALIDPPIGSTASPYWSVAYETVDPSASTTCTQLGVGVMGGSTEPRLAERTWKVNSDGSSSPSTLTGWSQLATVGSASTAQPFTLSVPTGAAFQQLRVRLVATDGKGQATASVSEITFTALNSAAAVTTPPTMVACPDPGIS